MLFRSLFVDSRGRLTTTDTGVQALQIAQNPATVVPFYRSAAGGSLAAGTISNWSAGSLVTGADLVAASGTAVAGHLPIQFNTSGNKQVATPLADRGYQARGYQQMGYYRLPDGRLSTTTILAGATIVIDPHNAMSVPLYERRNSAGQWEITTEKLVDSDLRPLMVVGTPSFADQPLYLDANGNLTTVVTSIPDWRRGIQRTDGAGNPLYVTAAGTAKIGRAHV